MFYSSYLCLCLAIACSCSLMIFYFCLLLILIISIYSCLYLFSHFGVIFCQNSNHSIIHADYCHFDYTICSLAISFISTSDCKDISITLSLHFCYLSISSPISIGSTLYQSYFIILSRFSLIYCFPLKTISLIFS